MEDNPTARPDAVGDPQPASVELPPVAADPMSSRPRGGVLAGAAGGAAVGQIVAGALSLGAQRFVGPLVVDVLAGAALAVLALAAVQLLAAATIRAARWVVIRRRRSEITWSPRAWVGAWPGLVVALLILPRVPGGDALPVGLVGVLAVLGVAATIVGALLGAAQRARTPRRRSALQVVAAGLVVVLIVGAVHPGSSRGLAPPSRAPVTALHLDDPTAPGSYAVETMTYGSGTRGLPPAFADEATLRTEPVDVTSALPDPDPFYAAYLRMRFTGDDELPVNGRVWMPRGEGPFPLAVVVHGNHALEDDSTPGYAYLGEHLASHGIITVSVDQNLLNGNVFGDRGGAEVPVRSWLLLEHLRWWQRWSETPGTPVTGRVDLDSIVLIGHSRGGEAAANAAALNVEPVAPVASLMTDEHQGFGIRGVVALAPTDGMWPRTGSGPTLQDASYLLVHGAHDADLEATEGLRQHARTQRTPEGEVFRAVAYLRRANHGQFNSGWGRGDIGTIDTPLLNRARLLSAAEQQRAATAVVTSFAFAVLDERDGYRSLFAQPDAAAGWLPDDVVVTSYLDGTFDAVVDPERALERQGLVAREVDVERRTPATRDGSTTGDPALALDWSSGADAAVTLPVEPAVAGELRPEDVVTLRWLPTDADHPVADLAVTLHTAGGPVASVSISRVTALRPLLPAKLFRSRWFTALTGAEVPAVIDDANVVLQTYELPLAMFLDGQPGLEPADVTAVELQPDTSAGGAAFLDDVGFRQRTDGQVTATSAGP